MRLAKAFLPRQVEYVEVATGEEALEELTVSASGFDVAFLDDSFGTDLLRGLDVTCALRERGVMSRACEPLPIVGCSGSEGNGEHNSAALLAGQCFVWGKPQPSTEQMRQQLTELLHL